MRPASGDSLRCFHLIHGRVRGVARAALALFLFVGVAGSSADARAEAASSRNGRHFESAAAKGCQTHDHAACHLCRSLRTTAHPVEPPRPSAAGPAITAPPLSRVDVPRPARFELARAPRGPPPS
jgi:hypothetical protein